VANFPPRLVHVKSVISPRKAILPYLSGRD
jgi:hypothetical protein